MNYLDLGQRLASECGVSGTLLTMAGQTGSLGRIVNWTAQAWAELQTLHDDWEWLRSSNLLGSGMSFTTVAGTASYPLGTGSGTCGVTAALFGKWDRDTFRCYTTSAGFSNETDLDNIRYDKWRNSYMLGAMRNGQTRPVAVAVGPDKSICLGPPPNALYTITGDYFLAPSAMSLDTDTPTGLPAQFHMLIVYMAMEYYAAYESAPEVLERAMSGSARLRGQLEQTYAPELVMAGALA